MKSLHLLSIFIPLLLFINDVDCIRNLFLPKTGDINGISSSVIAENLSNVTNFEGLLGAGRSLAYPFAAGLILAISTIANENNWKVSDGGFSKVLGIPREEIVDSYGSLLEMLETDENVTLSNTLFSFRPNFSPSEALAETLMTEVREVTWTRETWKQTHQLMVEHLGNVTNEKIDTLLVPKVTKIGTPFRKNTEAVILSTFHYINGWQYPWTDAEVGKFRGNEGIPYLKVEGSFLVSDEDEYTAVSVPLEGGSKSIVFVLPHVNITSKYFRNQADGEDGEGDEPTDIVPFPKKWKMKKLHLRVPAFNTTDVDQYGQELEQIGMNETFCTILRDYFGRFPYYLRPMVQVNFFDFNEDFLELASATGVAVEKFQPLFSVVAEGSGDKMEKDDEKKKDALLPDQNRKNGSIDIPTQATNVTVASVDLDNGNGRVHVKGEIEKDNIVAPTVNVLELETVPPTDTGIIEVETVSLDRPFLWYLNDSEVGPIFFGTVENLLNLALMENSTDSDSNDENTSTTMPPPPSGDEMNGNNTSNNNNSTMNTPENDPILSEYDKYYLWSCRSFASSSAGTVNNELPSLTESSAFEENSTGAINSEPLSSATESDSNIVANTIAP